MSSASLYEAQANCVSRFNRVYTAAETRLHIDLQHEELKKEEEVRKAMSYGYPVTSTTDMNGKYIIWNPTSLKPPRYVFESRDTAIKAAYSMANASPGEKFVVMKAVGEARTESVAYKDFEK